MIISSEVEITHIMNGLRAVLYECLGIQSDRTLIKEEFNYLSWNEDDDGQTIG